MNVDLAQNIVLNPLPALGEIYKDVPAIKSTLWKREGEVARVTGVQYLSMLVYGSVSSADEARFADVLERLRPRALAVLCPPVLIPLVPEGIEYVTTRGPEGVTIHVATPAGARERNALFFAGAFDFDYTEYDAQSDEEKDQCPGMEWERRELNKFLGFEAFCREGDLPKCW